MKSRVSIILMLALAGTVPARAAIEFAGYSRMGAEFKVVLSDTTAGRTSEWIGRGAMFAGYTVTEFDASTETLTLARAGETTQLRLKGARLTATDWTGIGGSASTAGEGALLRRFKEKIQATRAEETRRGRPYPEETWDAMIREQVDTTDLLLEDAIKRLGRQQPRAVDVQRAETMELARYLLEHAQARLQAAVAKEGDHAPRLPGLRRTIGDLEKMLAKYGEGRVAVPVEPDAKP